MSGELARNGVKFVLDHAPMVIVVKACDIADQESVNALVEDCAKTLPPIRGVIHAAMVLRVSRFCAFADVC